MSKFNQKEGVFSVVCQVVGQDSFDGAVELTKDQRSEVIELVTQGLLKGEIEMKDEARAKHDTEAKMRTYTNGLVSNWLRKDLRLNGGEKYEIKNKGSRAGSGDKVIKELKKLRSTLTDEAQIAAVNAEIDKRMAVIKAEKAKSIEIDTSLIPEDLLDMIS